MNSAPDWKAEAERWKQGVNLETATDKDITDFIMFKLWEYNEYKTMDVALWSFFQDDFEGFDVATFLRVHAQHLRSMYDFLRRGGVYIRAKEKRVTYAQLLFEITQEERQHPWTQEELEEVYVELGGNEFQSNKMNNAIKRGLNYKVTQDPTVRTTQFQLQQQTPLQLQQQPPPFQPQQQLQQLVVPVQTPGWGKEISNAAKMYTEDLKYNGTNGSFVLPCCTTARAC
jgi:hypothetical protein